jgi:hypothetical protein
MFHWRAAKSTQNKARSNLREFLVQVGGRDRSIHQDQLERVGLFQRNRPACSTLQPPPALILLDWVAIAHQLRKGLGSQSSSAAPIQFGNCNLRAGHAPRSVPLPIAGTGGSCARQVEDSREV